MSATILAIDEVCHLTNVTLAPSLVDGYYQGRGKFGSFTRDCLHWLTQVYFES